MQGTALLITCSSTDYHNWHWQDLACTVADASMEIVSAATRGLRGWKTFDHAEHGAH